MRWTPLIALTVLLPVASALAQTDNTAPPKVVKTPTSLPAPKAEPENAQSYGPVILDNSDNGPTDADVGPAQKHFIRASTLDDLAETQNADNASLISHEKIALDKRLSVKKIHDVQDDGENGGGDNHSLRYEVTYLNWGAVTQEQFNARRGHYFTITWDNDGPKADFTARFEYREVKTQEIVRTLTQKMPAVSGSARSYFAVVNKAYMTYGPVVSWRFTVLKGDTVVAEAKSFIW